MADDGQETSDAAKLRKILLIVNCIMLCFGTTGGPLLMRLYFVHDGTKVWLSAWLETGGWPVIIAPLAVSYIHRRCRWVAATAKMGCVGSTSSDVNSPEYPKPVLMKPFLFMASAVVGVLTGLDDYLYAYGVARLPVSTSALIIASQLAFTAVFCFLLVKQRFTAYSINAVVLLTVGAAVLAMHAGTDRPEGESDRAYMMGFAMTVAAAALYGFVLPLVELSYNKSKQPVTYTLVLEYQFVMCFFATAFCTVGMLINKDFQTIPSEAKKFGLGEPMYYFVLVLNGVAWQCFFLGAIGVIFCASSLLSGILIAVMLPVTEVLAVVFYKEKFSAEKAVALSLSIWGFVSYFYGELKKSHHQEYSNLGGDPNDVQNQDPSHSDMETNGRSIP